MLFTYKIVAKLAALYFASLPLRHVTVLNCWSPNGNDEIQIETYLANDACTVYAFVENAYLLESMRPALLMVNIFSLATNASASQEIVANLMRNNHTEIGVFMQFDCDASDHIIRQCSTEQCFSQKFHWLLYDGGQSSALLRALNQTDLHVDAEITVADLDSMDVEDTMISIPLYDVYNNGHHAGGVLRVHYDRSFKYSVANESGSLEPSQLAETPKYVRRRDLTDLTFRVGTVYQIYDGRRLTNESIIEHLMSENNTEYDVLNRPTFQMGLHVQELLRFRAIYVHNAKWTGNDSHGGALGDIIAGRTDIAYVMGGINDIRLHYMALIVESRDFRSMFFFRTYGSQKPGLTGNSVLFFKPFATPVWCTLAGVIAALGIAVYLSLRFELQRRASVYLSAMTALGAFCQQGASITPGTLTGKGLLMWLYGTSVLVYTYYTTEVLNALIRSPVRQDIRTLEQLALSHLTVGLENVSHTVSYLKVTDFLPDLQLLKERKLAGDNETQAWLWPPLTQGLDRVRVGGYAYQCEAYEAYAYIRKTFAPVEMCDLNEIYMRPKMLVGYLANKRSPYLELFKQKFRKFRETGIQSKYNRRWLPAKPACLVDSFVFSVGMEYVAPLFLFLAIAMAVCFAVLAVELAVHRWQSSVV